MIHQLVKRFHYLERDINALVYSLIIFFLILVAQSAYYIINHEYDQLRKVVAPSISILVALLIARASNRLIVNDRINRENERRYEIIRVTHYFIAISQDLINRVNYVELMLRGDDGITRPALALTQIAMTIEDRYETLLLEKNAYKYLPSECIEIILKISESIYGIRMLAEGAKHTVANNSMMALKDVPLKTNSETLPQLNKLIEQLGKFVDELKRLRSSLDEKQIKL